MVNNIEFKLILYQILPDFLRNPDKWDLFLHQKLPKFLRILRNFLRDFIKFVPVPAPMHPGTILD
jgi:hypothetical protein